MNKATKDEIHISVKYINDPSIRYRYFNLNNSYLTISARYYGRFFQRINLHPDQKIIKNSDKEIITEDIVIHISEHSCYTIQEYEYSTNYDSKIAAKCLVISSEGSSFLHIHPTNKK